MRVVWANNWFESIQTSNVSWHSLRSCEQNNDNTNSVNHFSNISRRWNTHCDRKTCKYWHFSVCTFMFVIPPHQFFVKSANVRSLCYILKWQMYRSFCILDFELFPYLHTVFVVLLPKTHVHFGQKKWLYMFGCDVWLHII